jgi:hypothetical protein
MIEGGVAAAMGKGFSAGLDVAGETHFVRIEQRDGSHSTAEFALRLSAFARKAF